MMVWTYMMAAGVAANPADTHTLVACVLAVVLLISHFWLIAKVSSLTTALHGLEVAVIADRHRVLNALRPTKP